MDTAMCPGCGTEITERYPESNMNHCVFRDSRTWHKVCLTKAREQVVSELEADSRYLGDDPTTKLSAMREINRRIADWPQPVNRVDPDAGGIPKEESSVAAADKGENDG